MMLHDPATLGEAVRSCPHTVQLPLMDAPGISMLTRN
jgi:hypothetical protein